MFGCLRYLKIGALVLVCFLCFSACGRIRNAESADNKEREKYHTEKHFADFTYSRPDFDALQLKISRACVLAQQNRTRETLNLYDELLCDLRHADTMNTAANILYHFDLRNQEYQKETLLLAEKMLQADKAMAGLTRLVLNTGFADDAQKRWGEDFILRARNKNKECGQEFTDLSGEEQELINRYQELSAKYEYDFSDEPEDRATEETKNRILGDIYQKLICIRTRKAQLAGYLNYPDYAYELLGRDYTPSEAAAFCEEAKRILIPLRGKILEFYGDRIRTARKASAAVHLEDGFPVLGQALYEDGYPPAMRKAYDYMVGHGFYDISGGSGRMNSAYCTLLNEWGAPFLFINTDHYDSPSTLFHEFGHYCNFYRMGQTQWNDECSLDLAEVHSQGLELLMMNRYEELYGKDAAWMRCSQLLGMIDTILEGCAEDEFQQAVYCQPGQTTEKINALHAEIYEQYFGIPDDLGWVEIHHHFETPFYYISYAVSAVSALELWKTAQENRQEAMRIYDALLQDAPNGRFRTELQKAGLSDPFCAECIEKTAQTVADVFGFEQNTAAHAA